MARTRTQNGTLLGTVAALLALGLGQAGAQDATPVAPAGTPTAATCDAEPRPLADFQALIGAPIPPTPATFAPPAGEPAGDEIVTDVTATFNGLVACFNATDLLRFGGYYTDAGFREDVAPTAEQFVPIIQAGIVFPPDIAISVVDVRDVVVLDDGRVGAVVVYASPEGETTDYIIFAEENGRYLIDFFVDEYGETAPATPAAATPVA